jgi:hypothetical protein
VGGGSLSEVELLKRRAYSFLELARYSLREAYMTWQLLTLSRQRSFGDTDENQAIPSQAFPSQAP